MRRNPQHQCQNLRPCSRVQSMGQVDEKWDYSHAITLGNGLCDHQIKTSAPLLRASLDWCASSTDPDRSNAVTAGLQNLPLIGLRRRSACGIKLGARVMPS